MTQFLAVKRIDQGEALIQLTADNGAFYQQTWREVNLRKSTECEGCGAWLLSGKPAYAPKTNEKNRAMRLCIACCERLGSER